MKTWLWLAGGAAALLVARRALAAVGPRPTTGELLLVFPVPAGLARNSRRDALVERNVRAAFGRFNEDVEMDFPQAHLLGVKLDQGVVSVRTRAPELGLNALKAMLQFEGAVDDRFSVETRR